MRLPESEHTSRPWRIHEITRDFQLEDVWALPTPGGPDDLPLLIDLFDSDDDDLVAHPVVRALFAARTQLGKLFGLDAAGSAVGARVSSLQDRLPADLPAAPPPTTPASDRLDPAEFAPIYELPDEWAAEMSNRTCHMVLHLGWVRDGDTYLGHMAVLVKPNGLLGRTYMAFIKPFRHLLVYPLFFRSIGRKWTQRVRT